MNGILLIDKPSGWTSFDVVAKVRGILRKETGQKVKIGHTGTLDPLAIGLLVLLIGNYTKKATELSKLDKTYEVTMKLGETSTTGDAEGQISNISNKKPTQIELENVLKSFVGEIEQIPPVFSAVKVGGQRAYKLARAGKEVKLEPRKVKIHSIFLKKVRMNKDEVEFICEVSSGTYIRSLVEDIGQKLGTGAYMSALNRTKVGKFKLNQAINLPDLSAEVINSELRLA